MNTYQSMLYGKFLLYKLHFLKIEFHNLRDLTYETKQPEKLAILCSFSTSATPIIPFL